MKLYLLAGWDEDDSFVTAKIVPHDVQGMCITEHIRKWSKELEVEASTEEKAYDKLWEILENDHGRYGHILTALGRRGGVFVNGKLVEKDVEESTTDIAKAAGLAGSLDSLIIERVSEFVDGLHVEAKNITSIESITLTVNVKYEGGRTKLEFDSGDST